MNDGVVTRSALGVALASLSSIQLPTNEDDDLGSLKTYILLCPFLSSDSPAMHAALSFLDNVDDKKELALTDRVTPKEVSIEARRVALRVTLAAFHDLMLESETGDDFDLMGKYIRLWPFLDQDCPLMCAVLKGLCDAKVHGPPPPLFGESDSDSEREQQNLTKTPELEDSKPPRPSRWPVVLRTVLLEIPLLLLFATFASILWLDRVDTLYLKNQIEAAIWDEDRGDKEITYYERVCDARDMTTTRGSDLIISANATVDEAYRHQLRHGFSVFPSVLTEKTMTDLRSYIDSRNRELRPDEKIFVIEGDKRFSFGLGTEIPSVAAAVKEVATHEQLAPTLEKVLGPEPALIEFTAITSSAGAISQYWHDDVIAAGSVLKWGRTFSPSYSLFIQLQNTTREMGATSVCPGTFMCPAGEMHEFCEREGFQLVDEKTGRWNAGNALLMNMNSWHRGAAHTDYDAPDRIMFILTFIANPAQRAESRQMSQGITFSLRWDMWGHTLGDLKEADTAMVHPWAFLRSMGLYKKPKAAWGIDYISSATMRMANNDNGFRRDELDDFIKLGGFQYLPTFLHGRVSEEQSFYDYYHDTLYRCKEFAILVNGVAAFVYLGLFFSIGVIYPKRGHFQRALIRSGVIYVSVLGLWQAANWHVDNTHWAKDIKAGRRFASAFESTKAVPSELRRGPSTMPNRYDVLVETKYQGRHLALYNDFIQSHPANELFRESVRNGAIHYKKLPYLFRRATAKYIVGAIQSQNGRFLFQEQDPVWTLLSEDDAIDFTEAELAVESDPLLKALRQEIQFLASDGKYGYLRDTAMGQRFSVQHCIDLRNLILLNATSGKAAFTSLEKPETPTFLINSAPPTFRRRSTAKILEPTRSLYVPHLNRNSRPPVDVPVEPYAGAWLKSGDVVDGCELSEDDEDTNDSGGYHWYKGILHKVTAQGVYEIDFFDDTSSLVYSDRVRAFQPYRIGEEVEVFTDIGVEDATIVTANDDGTFDLYLQESDVIFNDIEAGFMRRKRQWTPSSEELDLSDKYV